MNKEDRLVKEKVSRSIINRQRAGFSRLDVRRDSGASMQYIHDIVSEMVTTGKLECYSSEGNLKCYRKAAKKRNKPIGKEKLPFWMLLLYKRKHSLGSWAKVARELEISPATLSTVIAGKYGADTVNIEKTVVRKYQQETVDCPLKGKITRAECFDNKDKALEIGVRGPAHIRDLRRKCLQCEL